MIDSIEHKFWLCPVTQEIWKDISNWYEDTFGTKLHLNMEIIIFNITDNQMMEFIILCTKFHIYKSFLKSENPNLYKLKNELVILEKLELSIATRKNKQNIHNEKWGKLSSMQM